MNEETRASSFDELARGLASGHVSRRKALRLMGAALVGGTLASLGIGEAVAAPPCKGFGKRCTTNAQCCSGSCSTNGTCSAACPSGTVELSNGTCAVPCGTSPEPGFPECANCQNLCGAGFSGGYCYSLGGSQRRCKSDSQCPTGEFCSTGGSCTTACSSPVVG
jgi:Cys-rich repeat protein